MNYLTILAAFFGGMLAMALLGLWLMYRAHENFRKMCTTPPKGK